MGAGLVRRIGSKLVLRIYFVGLVQFGIVAAALFAIASGSRPPVTQFLDTEHFVASTVAASADDPRALAEVVARAEKELHWMLAVYDESGTLVAQTSRPPKVDSAIRLRRAGEPRADKHPGEIALRTPSGRAARLVFEPAMPPAPPGIGSLLAIVLVVVGVVSWLTARSLTRPLLRLSDAARAFGAGDITARVGRTPWSDELSQVATAFDEMAERVTRALRAERELLANVSHELRTPLQRIRIALDIAAEGDAQAARESLGEIAEDLGELERIVEDVLTAARLSLQNGVGQATAAPPSRKERLDIRALLDKSAARFRAAHSRPLVTQVSDGLPSLDADAVLLRRVVDNLLDNANKYTEAPNAEVTLRAFSNGNTVTIEVEDHGIGMSKQDLERAFEPFFRADRSRTRATGGLGLGLALARRIVESHGGTLSLSSEMGKGTSARIVLPTAPGT